MMITSTEIVVVGAPRRELTFVELQTDNGLRGVGEVRMVNKTQTLVACIEELSSRYVVGRELFGPEPPRLECPGRGVRRTRRGDAVSARCFRHGLLGPCGTRPWRAGLEAPRWTVS
jgi:L-alanine-DL-glutamate epimerase-like enolase superfamily enzyme